MQVYARTYYCPDLLTQEDAIVVEETLQNSPGIEEVRIDHVLHTVFVSTANQGGMKDVEFMLRDAGFPPVEREEGEFIDKRTFA